MKLRLTSILFLFTAFVCRAQQAVEVRFFDQHNRQVKTRDSAYYTRTIYELDKATSLYDVKEVFNDGKPKLIGKTSKLVALTLEGLCTTYYRSGAKFRDMNYHQGHITEIHEYFANGILHLNTKYQLPPASWTGVSAISLYTVWTVNDSLGKPQVVDGNGYFVDKQMTAITKETSEGYLKDGRREGQWKGTKQTERNGTIAFTEIYKDGKLVSGFSMDQAGKQYPYIQGGQATSPRFKYGDQAFDNFLRNNIVYPEAAKAKRIAGRVYITFTVEKDGRLNDIHAQKFGNPDPELVAEAIRVVEKSPNWEPGTFYGQPVSVQYTVPINFTLNKSLRE